MPMRYGQLGGCTPRIFFTGTDFFGGVNDSPSHIFLKERGRTHIRTPTMPSRPDARREVGGRVHAKACHVLNFKECGCRYGSNAKTKLIPGTVVLVEERESAVATICNGGASTQQHRKSWFVTADFEVGGEICKRKCLNIRSIKAGNVPGLLQIFNSEQEPCKAPAAIEAQQTVEHPLLPDLSVTEGAYRQQLDNEIVVEAPSLSNDLSIANRSSSAASTVVVQEIDAIDITVPVGVDKHPQHQEVEPPQEVELLQEVEPPQEVVVGGPSTTPMAALYNHLFVSKAQGKRWFDATDRQVVLGDPVSFRPWAVQSAVGEPLVPGGTGGLDLLNHSRLDLFVLMFPPQQLMETVMFTNVVLQRKNKMETSQGEILRLFGIMILATKFEFLSRASLWSTVAQSKYRPAPSFGRTGMSRIQFDNLFSNLRFGNQPAERPPNLSSGQYRWLLVDNFINNFNKHRARNFIPSERICVDKLISCWYGQGGSWINQGLPQYVAIEQKPENGCKIQNAACGCSGVMIRLKLVKSADEEQSTNNKHCLHGTAVLNKLVLPWRNTNRIVCADSYFASVEAAESLLLVGLRFIGVVKSATQRFPKQHLHAIELHTRGESKGLYSLDNTGHPSLLSFVWMDRKRRYFICSTSSLAPGVPYTRQRWQQVSHIPNVPPELVEIAVHQPKAAEVYYNTCAVIDRHNQCQQDNLMLEKKLKTKEWSLCVNMSLLAIIIVDTWLVYSGCRRYADDDECAEAQKDFYSCLAEELIDNQFDTVTTCRSLFASAAQKAALDAALQQNLVATDGLPQSGTSIHLTPTKKKRKLCDGTRTNFLKQGRCLVCSLKTTYLCSACNDNSEIENEPWLCGTKRGKLCFLQHYDNHHSTIDSVGL